MADKIGSTRPRRGKHAYHSSFAGSPTAGPARPPDSFRTRDLLLLEEVKDRVLTHLRRQGRISRLLRELKRIRRAALRSKNSPYAPGQVASKGKTPGSLLASPSRKIRHASSIQSSPPNRAVSGGANSRKSHVRLKLASQHRRKQRRDLSLAAGIMTEPSGSPYSGCGREKVSPEYCGCTSGNPWLMSSLGARVNQIKTKRLPPTYGMGAETGGFHRHSCVPSFRPAGQQQPQRPRTAQRTRPEEERSAGTSPNFRKSGCNYKPSEAYKPRSVEEMRDSIAKIMVCMCYAQIG